MFLTFGSQTHILKNMKCDICPRNCQVDRAKNIGFCKASNKIMISKIMLHQGEEPFLSRETDKGSGAIFFAGCNLRCVYCQNYKISHQMKGKQFTIPKLAQTFKMLENKGASNIDLVTPTHFTNQIIKALKCYKPNIPVIWNTSGYEKAQTIEKLDGLVDIYLIDFKYASNDLANKYSKAPDYVENAKQSLIAMKNQIKTNIFENKKLIHGIVVRHMVLPGNIKDSFTVLDLIKEILGDDALVSIMSQYTPQKNCEKYPEINRKITTLEYKAVIAHATKIGLKNCLIQDLDSSGEDLIPNFDSEIIEI